MCHYKQTIVHYNRGKIEGKCGPGCLKISWLKKLHQ